MNDEVAFSVVGGKVEQLTEVSLEDIGFRERKHLQRWIEDYPEIVGPNDKIWVFSRRFLDL